jgi:hypothetical protein
VGFSAALGFVSVLSVLRISPGNVGYDEWIGFLNRKIPFGTVMERIGDLLGRHGMPEETRILHALGLDNLHLLGEARSIRTVLSAIRRLLQEEGSGSGANFALAYAGNAIELVTEPMKWQAVVRVKLVPPSLEKVRDVLRSLSVPRAAKDVEAPPPRATDEEEKVERRIPEVERLPPTDLPARAKEEPPESARSFAEVDLSFGRGTHETESAATSAAQAKVDAEPGRRPTQAAKEEVARAQPSAGGTEEAAPSAKEKPPAPAMEQPARAREPPAQAMEAQPFTEFHDPIRRAAGETGGAAAGRCR